MVWLNMLQLFIVQHWLDVTAVVVVICVATWFWVNGYKRQVKMVIYDLVVKAEQQLGNGTGPIKYLRVTRWIYSRMPWVVKIFVSEDELDDWIDLGVEELEKFLLDGGNILSYAEEHFMDESLDKEEQ